MKEKIIVFIKSNFIVWAFIAIAVIIELTGVCVTSGRFLIRKPYMFLSLLSVFTAILFTVKNQKGRYWCAFAFMLLFFAVDLVFIIVYEMTGSTFDFSMLKLRSDAMAIVESVPINFIYALISGVCISLYLILARHFMKKVPSPTRLFPRGVFAAALAVVLATHAGMAYLENRHTNPADLSYKLYSGSDGTYYDRGIMGNFIDELYKGAFFSKVPLGDEKELEDFIYESDTTAHAPEYHGIAEGYNVITVLAESFEWFSFMADLPDAGLENAFPYGFSSFGIGEAQLRELYPNLYEFYDESVVCLNHHAREKTDISENQSIIGNYPTECFINYDYPYNTIPYSLPNIMNSLYGVESYSFHNGEYTFYNRNVHHENALGFKEYTASEQMADLEGFTDYFAENRERNLDTEMINACREQMFPADRRFNTYITSISMHGQYDRRDNLSPYYELLAEYGMKATGNKSDEIADAFVYYAATALEFDRAIGAMIDYLDEKNILDNTLIVMFGDHNAYYQTLSPNVKDLFLEEDNGRNYTDLFRVPMMIRVGGEAGRRIEADGKRFVTKFTTTTDIVPTILGLLGIHYYDSLSYGTSIFSAEESIIYSRAYNVFITDKLYFASINNIKFAAPDVTDDYTESVKDRAITLLDKTSHVNRIFYYDFLSGERADTYYAKLKELNGMN